MTGCEWINALARMVTSKSNNEALTNARVVMSDRRIVDASARVILREIARKAAQAAAKAAEDGEL